MLWVVLDTNTLVSGFGWPTGAPGRIIEHLLEGRFLMVTTSELLDELGRVLNYPRLHSAFPDPMAIALLVETIAVRVEPRTRLQVVRDPDDDRVLEAAMEAHVDYIVTGDDDILSLGSFEGSDIVPPKEFLRILESEDSA